MKTFFKAAAAVCLLLVLLACPPGHGVALSWQSGGGYSAMAYYKVYRSQDGAAFGLAATVQQATPTWTDSTVSSGHWYAYRVTAYDAQQGGESIPSNTFTVAIP